MTFGSLFAGIGGFDLALERAGMRCAWQCEIAQMPRKILEKRWPDVPRYEDVRTLGDLLEKTDGSDQTTRPVFPDLLCGGFPCQDVSVAGRRAGLAGQRSGLWWEFRRIISLCRPTWVLIENVPGLLSSNGGRDMGALLWSLGKLGYGWAYRVLDAQWFGLAQRRARVFIVGCLGDARRAAEVLFEPESMPWHPAPSREKREGVAGGVAACLNSGGNNGGFRSEPGEHLVACFGGTGRMDFESETFVINKAFSIQERANSENPKSGPQGKGFQEDLAFTLEARRPQSVSCGSTVRRLMPIEAERLQGFPDGWTEGLSDLARYKCLGNAVAVPVVEWIARRIKQAAKG